MTVRYFVPDFPDSGGTVVLPAAEAHHAASVMRIRVGEGIMLFDGLGNESAATIVSASRREVVCMAQPKRSLPRGNQATVSMAVAMPKGDRARDLIERLTELGVDRVVPIHCERSPWAVSDAAVAKWERVMIEACKQSSRNRLMAIDAPCRLADHLAEGLRAGEVGWFAHPDHLDVASAGVPPGPPQDDGDCPKPSPGDGENAFPPPTAAHFRIAIGPEGGFSETEAAMARNAGWMSVSLGPRIYRIETAAVIMAVKAAGI